IFAQQRIAELCLKENRQDEATSVYLQLGRERSAQGRYDEAKEAYLAVLRIDPKNSEAGQFVESMKNGKTGPITPPKPGATVSAAQSSESLGPLAEAVRRMDERQYEGAEAILNQMLSREPGNPQVCQLLARLHLQRGDALRGDLQVALGEYRFLAGAALRAKDLASAESLIQEFLSVQPDSVPLLELYGELYEEQQNPAAAAQQYARAVELLLTHPEPGMEGLHEELFDKVRSLSSDSGFVERLAVKMRGGTASSAHEPAAEPMMQGSGSNTESDPGDVPPDAVSSRSDQGLHFSLDGAEPDGASPFKKQSPSEIGGFTLANAEPDGANPFERHASAQAGDFVLTNAVPDGDGLQILNPTSEGVPDHASQGEHGESEPPAVVPPKMSAPPPDHEAHFALGVAYKNMGLYTEAREEFTVSKTGEAFCLDSCLMSALCWKEEGRFVQAVQELEPMLSDPRCQGAKGQAIRYELGLLYESESQWAKAAATFQLIPSFHDVPQRLLALKNKSQMPAGGIRLAS
ncbi:MAG: tetratricopeptide repeat protein, partial [Nitrospira sp.]|nr:tetratricopeptide repeat protein [Nitrospira sp.]